MRIVSLIASATEIISALAFEQHLVARSHECDFPLSVQKLPICTAPRFHTAGSSVEIDRRVRAIIEKSLSVYRVDSKLLQSLRPDVIITQTHCEVCAVSLQDVESAVCDWIGSRPKLVALAPNCLADVWKDIRLVAEALGVPDRGEQLVRSLQRRMDDIAAIAGVQPVRPAVACIEWIEPLMSAGNWMPELVDRAGGIHLFGLAGQHSPKLNWQQVVQADPEVILVMPCGWDIARCRQEMPVLTGKPEWPALHAVREGRVVIADGNQYFNRPGPRLVESLEILAEVLHPGAFHFGHEGTAWVAAASG
jgi:iron complex transport system substrate-binding protein